MNQTHRHGHHGDRWSLGFCLLTVSALALAAMAPSAVLKSAGPEADSKTWNREQAARYLDDRMDAWFANANKVRTDEGQTTCVSCHTPVPYALARPALRRAGGVAAPTPQEARLVDEVTRRVQTYGTHQLSNDFDEVKKLESRGTEAVLNALVLANRDAVDAASPPSDSTRKAFRELWATERADGTWDWLQFGLEPFESVNAWFYGSTVAALAVSKVPALMNDRESAQGVEKLRRYLKANYATQSLFNKAWLLLSSEGMKILQPAERQALIAELERRQQQDGGWSLQSLGPWKWARADEPFNPPGTLDTELLAKSDGYATGLVVYAMRQAGVPADRLVIQQGLQWLRTNQREIQVGDRSWNAWRAWSLNFDREHGGTKGEPWRRLFMSDSATAFAVLALSQ